MVQIVARLITIAECKEGGVGSGNYGHPGRPGIRGGSGPSGSSKPYYRTHNFVSRIMTGIAKDQGITISTHGEIPSHGFVVGGAGHEEIHGAANLKSADVTHYINAEIGNLTKANHYFGAWVDGNDVYFDVSTVRADKSAALEEGRARDQIAIWSLDEGKGYNTMSDGQRPSQSSGDPLNEAQKSTGPALLMFGHNASPEEIVSAIKAESNRQIKSGHSGSRTITIRPQSPRK